MRRHPSSVVPRPSSRTLIVKTQVAERWSGVLPTTEWLAGREPLIAGVTAAALRRVTVPFTWVWTTAPELREQVVAMAERVFPAAVVVDSGEVPSAAAIGDGQYLTVRLDSDDAILPSAIDALADLRLDRGWMVDWPKGWMLDWATGRVAEREWPWRRQSPFLALTHERRETVLDLCRDHSVAREGRMRLVVAERSWLQTIHGGNQMNKWRGAEPVDEDTRKRVLTDYGIEDVW